MDKNKLKEDCDNGLSVAKIAKKNSVSSSTIRYWLKKYGLKTHAKAGNHMTSELAQTLCEKRWRCKSKMGDLDKVDWNEIQIFYDSGGTFRGICEKYKIHNVMLQKARGLGYIKFLTGQESSSRRRKLGLIKKKVLSETTKTKISKGRKEWLASNPDKHPWTYNDKFISKPCETLKSKLKELNFIFKEEFQPFSKISKFYSCDIAFPELKMAIEVNGEQHYNRDRKLNKYYQDRHDFFLAQGWKVLELHYAMVYKENIIELITNFLSN